jgi:hypothetical protein
MGDQASIDQQRAVRTYFIVYVSHVHNELHIISEIFDKNPSNDILGDIVSRERQDIILPSVSLENGDSTVHVRDGMHHTQLARSYTT